MTNLFIEYYQDSCPLRQAEIDECISNNIKNEFIHKIIIFCEFDISRFSDKKIVHIPFTERLTYEAFFKETANYPNDTNILSNTDIFFDETIQLAGKIKENECYALLRYNVQADGSLYLMGGGSRDSQDCWIFKGTVKTVKDCNFTLGVAGCDNRIAFLIHEAGYEITNTCHSIKAYHLHITNKRNYDRFKS